MLRLGRSLGLAQWPWTSDTACGVTRPGSHDAAPLLPVFIVFARPTLDKQAQAAGMKPHAIDGHRRRRVSDGPRRADPEAEQKRVGDQRRRAAQHRAKAQKCTIGGFSRQFADGTSIGEQAYDIVMVHVVIDSWNPGRIGGTRVRHEPKRAKHVSRARTGQRLHRSCPRIRCLCSTRLAKYCPATLFTRSDSRRSEHGRVSPKRSPHTRPCQAGESTLAAEGLQEYLSLDPGRTQSRSPFLGALLGQK